MGYAFCAFGGLFSRGLEAHKAKAKQGKGKGQSDTRCAMRDARCAMRDARCAMRLNESTTAVFDQHLPFTHSFDDVMAGGGVNMRSSTFAAICDPRPEPERGHWLPSAEAPPPPPHPAPRCCL
jgi:hypothetical protein